MAFPMDDREFREWVDGEVDRRLRLILSNEGAVRRFAVNGHDQIDDDALSVLEATVTADVLRESVGQPTRPSSLDEGRRTWSVEDECSEPSLEHPVLEVLQERYELLREIGGGTQGRTFLGRSREHGEYVAIKELSFDVLESWKALELFQREAKVLESVSHPAIPSFVDTFDIEAQDEDEDSRFFLVQQFVSGESLDVGVAKGVRYSERQLRDLAAALLSVLDYLHGLHPPVVHRDIKPSNIIRTGPGAYALVDFGAAQMVLPDETGGSTIVGTSGYMPPEQLAGRTRPGSDLYALGATLAHLATGVHPTKMRQERLRLQWRERAAVSDALADFIDLLLEPVVEDRIASASEALELLANLASPIQRSASDDPRVLSARRPPNADARIRWEGDAMVVDMSRSSITPRVICGSLGLVVGVFLVFMVGNWLYAAGGLLLGLLASEAWSTGPDENLRLTPGGQFRLLHVDRRNRRETSGNVVRLALYGNRLHLQTSAGTVVDVGAHCSPQTRRWIFARVDQYLREHVGL